MKNIFMQIIHITERYAAVLFEANYTRDTCLCNLPSVISMSSTNTILPNVASDIVLGEIRAYISETQNRIGCRSFFSEHIMKNE